MVAAAAVVWPLPGRAQRRPGTIAVVLPTSQPAAGATWRNLAAFRHGLLESGIANDDADRVLVRWADGDMRLARAHMVTLIAEGADVLVTPSFPISEVAAQLPSSVPIVTVSSDPVGTGLVTSLARPGRNVTGLSYMTPELNAKRLELLKEAIPTLRRVAVLMNPSNRHEALGLARARDAADILQIDLQTIAYDRVEELEDALLRAIAARTDALFPFENVITATHYRRIIEFANHHRLPTMFELTDFAASGAFMTYGPSYRELFTRAGVFAGRLLRGASPADLPVEQPTRLELAINTATARTLGISFPPALLVRADEVIE